MAIVCEKTRRENRKIRKIVNIALKAWQLSI